MIRKGVETIKAKLRRKAQIPSQSEGMRKQINEE